MQEDFLHYLWKHKKFETNHLKTTAEETVTIQSVGQHNLNAGPDFFNAHLVIGSQLWAGNVEIHIKSSDWYLHNHERDSLYDNVILHIVWEHDTDIFRQDNSPIPTLQLKDFIEKNLLNNYENLFSKQNKWINCQNDFASIDDFVFKNWLERLYFERLEKKSKPIEFLLQKSKNNWESVLFKILTRNFGLKVNGDSFFSLAESIDFAIIRKTQSNQQTLEALLFGQGGFLDQEIEDGYFLSLVKEYEFLKQKFTLNNSQVLPINFFRLRPPNFPTIRLSQLACLYHEHQNLFSKIIECHRLEDYYKLLNVSTSIYWETHFTFQNTTKKSKKGLTKTFIDLLLINTILPIKFSYAKQKGEDVSENIINLATEITSEKNSIIDAFNNLKNASKSSLDSQALIQLKTNYCDKNRCLKCVIGNTLLSK